MLIDSASVSNHASHIQGSKAALDSTIVRDGNAAMTTGRGSSTFNLRKVISGGLNISAAEVERVVCEFPGVVEALAIAAPDPRFGETPMVIYHGPGEVDAVRLIEHCCGNLANYKVPRYIAFSPEPLPRLATGKLSKPAVRKAYKGAHERLERLR